jgi:hypothetical protein
MENKDPSEELLSKLKRGEGLTPQEVNLAFLYLFDKSREVELLSGIYKGSVTDLKEILNIVLNIRVLTSLITLGLLFVVLPVFISSYYESN